MYHSRYQYACSQLSESARRILEQAFALPRRGSIFSRLINANVSHADTTLTLLHANERAAVELLIGHPITICPPCLRQRFATIPRARVMRQVITFIGPNPHLFQNCSAQNPDPIALRYARLRIGMTIEQALNRGIFLADLRYWSRMKNIDIENANR